MNPPSALHSAMSRERKPFTYTPGGLDLSEIKSERMAKRLMRNAMNQGVPELPVQQVQSPPATGNPIMVPNFNCLPVQVFPTINLPANPKALLRTRSNPGPKEPPVQSPQPTPQPSQLPRPIRPENTAPLYSPINSNNASYQRPTSMYEYNTAPNNANTLPRTNYGSNEPPPFLPEMSYGAQYFQAPPRNLVNKPIAPEFKFDSKPIGTESPRFVDIESKPRNVDESASYYQPPTRNSNGFDAVIAQLECKQDNEPTKSEYSGLSDLKTNQQENNSEAFKIPDLDISVKTQILDFDKNELRDTSDSYKIPSLDISVKTEIVDTANEDETTQSFTIPNISVKTDIDKLESKENAGEECKYTDDDVKSETEDPAANDVQVDLDFSIQPISIARIPSPFDKPVEDKAESDDEQREVKVVKKQVKKESKSEVQNGDQNGDQEAQMTVKLPAKKSAAKTETKVEVVQKHLPDGSIEEIKTTTTRTTVDGKTTISTKTETTIIPKEEEEEVEVEEEEEQEEESGEVVVEENGDDEAVEEVVVVKKSPIVENGHKVVTEEETSETIVTKKVAVVQKQESEQEEEEEEEVEEEEVQEEKKAVKEEVVEEEKVVEEEQEEEEVVEESVEVKKEEVEVEEEEEVVEQPKKEEKSQTPAEVEEKEEEEVEEEYEEAEEKVEEEKVEKPKPSPEQKDEESEYTEEEYESEKEESPKAAPQVAKEEPPKEEVKVEETKVEVKEEPKEEKEAQPEPQTAPKLEATVPLREPSIPLEKVEDVEIKPIGLTSETVSKTHTENTEIITNKERPTGPLSTQTEYNRIENIVTVNRTTKTLDQSYEQLTQHGVPTVKAYFAPPNRDRISTSPLPSRPYQPVYPPVAQDQPQERRHSLLLERLSMERQAPSSDVYQNSYQYSNQSFEQQNQYSQEPQAEVLTVSNVKPSTITNSQWYQQQQQQQQVKKENVLYNNVAAPAPAPQSQAWSQPQPSPQPQSQPQYQPTYTDNTSQARPTSTYQQSAYQPYTPKPATWGPTSDTLQSSTYNTQQNQYSLLNQSTTDSYQKSTQQYSSSYVPPPWEQDSSYVADVSSQPQNFYQPSPASNTFTPGTNQGWTPAPPKAKFSKPPPTAYIPPAPNQSFVKPVDPMDAPRVPGKKTYYSEYERRYITVPESTYIPGESKYQPQPDPSPQYYYDNNEPAETVEPQWRKELREFTEKSSTQTVEQTSVKPPWEEDPKYVKPPSTIMYTATPTWSQTLRPQSWRERSFESEYVGSQEVSKTSTLGRGRPLSTYAKNNVNTIPERARGVSVDRYNPNSYQAPPVAEHPPVQTHTLNVVPPAKTYHNPNVPAYHSQSRASAEPREHAVYPQARNWGGVESRASPLQSRSFKYLQWITGTDD